MNAAEAKEIANEAGIGQIISKARGWIEFIDQKILERSRMGYGTLNLDRAMRDYDVFPCTEVLTVVFAVYHNRGYTMHTEAVIGHGRKEGCVLQWRDLEGMSPHAPGGLGINAAEARRLTESSECVKIDHYITAIDREIERVASSGGRSMDVLGFLSTLRMPGPDQQQWEAVESHYSGEGFLVEHCRLPPTCKLPAIIEIVVGW